MKPQTRFLALFLVLLISSLFIGRSLAVAGEVGLPRLPALSPNAERLIFSWAGSLWEVSTEGGEARRLTAHPGDDLRSAYSPDGRWIAFESRRAGYQHVFIADANFAEVRQLTFNDRYAYMRGFTADSNYVIFDSHLAHVIDRERQMYIVPVEGGPIRRLLDCLGRSAGESADGGKITFVRGFSSWTRRGYRGSAARDIWVYDKESGDFTQITKRDGNDGQPKFLPDGSIVFLSDRDNIVNVYRLPPNAGPATRAEQLTYFEEDDVRELAVSADGRMAAFIVWDRLYTLDLTRRHATPRALTLTTPIDLALPLEEEIDISREATSVVLSPDGNTYAFVARGEVFIKAVEGDRPTRRVTRTPWRESYIAWSADGQKLYFTSDKSGSSSIYAATVALDEIDLRPAEKKPEPTEDTTDPAEPAAEENAAGSNADADASDEPADSDEVETEASEEEAEEEAKPDKPRQKRWDRALRFDIETVLDTQYEDAVPTPSPDGRKLAFRRGQGDLLILDLESGETRALLEYWNLDSFEWSADSELIVFVRDDLDYSSNVWIVPSDGSRAPVNVSKSPDNDYQARLSADNKVLVFTSDREGRRNFDVYAVYFDKSLEALPAYEIKEYYDEAVKAAKQRKPIEPIEWDSETDAEDEAGNGNGEEEAHPFDKLDLDDAYLRLRRLTRLPESASDVVLTPGGDRVIFSAVIDGSPGLYSVKWDGSDRQRIDTGRVRDVRVSLTGDKVTYIRGGVPRSARPTGGAEEIPFRARILVDWQQEQKQKFLEASRLLGMIFYHPTMKGRDWPALTQKYLQLAMKTRTIADFNYIVDLLLGELDASHLGIAGPNPEAQWRRPVGYLGAEYDPAPEGYRIKQIYSNGPLDQGETGPQVGDLLVEVNGIAIPGEMVLEQAMLGMVGQQVLVTIQRADAAPDELVFVLADPISYWDQHSLAYNDEVLRRAEVVAEMSGGRLGYVHIQRMHEPNLHTFIRDLYAIAHDKDGLIIDVRSNGGGWINDMLLASLMVQRHAYTLPRIEDREITGHYPHDRLLIYPYTKPINVLCNFESFSNAEIFSHAIKTLGRGTLIGTPTYGGVISTGGTTLIDGASFRLPLRGWYLPDGTDMELNGAVPDIIVHMTPQDEVQGKDPQLEKAVEELLDRLP